MEILRELYKKYREQIDYLFYGAMTTAVNFLVYTLFAKVILGAELKTVAEAIALVTSVIFAFLVNKFRVFRTASDSRIVIEFISFLGARTLSGIIEIGGFFIFADRLGFNDYLVKIAVAVIVVIINYVLSKFLIFRK